jgi:hypothetical protein
MPFVNRLASWNVQCPIKGDDFRERAATMHDIFDLGDLFELLSLVWDLLEFTVRASARLVRWMTGQAMREGTQTIYIEKRASRAAEHDRVFSPTRRSRTRGRKASYAIR